MDIEISSDKSTVEAIGKLRRGLKTPIAEAIFDVSGFLENTLTENLDERIYSSPETPNYTRTGRALGGRYNQKVSDTKRKVINDTRLKPRANKPNSHGYTPPVPNYNYLPMLNKNRRIARLNTHFADDAFDETKEIAPKILKAKIDKYSGSK